MRNIVSLCSLYVLLSFFSLRCVGDIKEPAPKYDIPKTNHDLSYHPYDREVDDPDYVICDSTSIGSGRNRIQYVGGSTKLKKDIISNYVYDEAYDSFDGYVVIRFLVNCEGKSGRYRAQSLHLDFSPSNAPADLLAHSIELVESLDHWTKRPIEDMSEEYSKFINLKFSDGQIEYVLL